MKIVALVALLTIGFLGVNTAFAQKPDEGLKTKVFRWGSMMPAKGNAATAAKAAKNVSYSAARRKMMDTFVGWIQKSYTPVGGLPEPWYITAPESRTNGAQVPVTYGATILLWRPAYGVGGKITRAQPASASEIGISANFLPGMEAAWWFNTPTQYYFTMDIDRDGKLLDTRRQEEYGSYLEEARARIGGDYLMYITADRYINVLLFPGKRLPVVPVSRKEALQVAEVGAKRANVKGDNPKDRLDVQLQTIQKLREVYKDSLDEPALINQSQFNIYTFDTTWDAFKDGQILYPVYKFSPEVYAKCRTNQPQWITIRFQIPRKGDARDESIWKAMTEKFNYQYVYDYFFDPQKVTGKAYQVR